MGGSENLGKDRRRTFGGNSGGGHLKANAHIYENGVDSAQTVEPLANYLVGRFQKDFDRGNTILGGIVTHTHRAIRDEHLNFLGRDALSVGLDFTKYWADRKYFLEFKAIGSHIGGDQEAIRRLQSSSARYYQRPGSGLPYDTTSTRLNGAGVYFRIGKGSKGHWRYNQEVVLRTPGLEFNDLGFMRLANTIKNSTRISYVEKDKQWIFKNYDITLSQDNAWNVQGTGLYSDIELDADFELLNHWSIFTEAEYRFRIVDEQLLRGGPAMREPDMLQYQGGVFSNSSKKLFFGVYAAYSHRLTGNSRFFVISPQMSYRPFSNVRLSLDLGYERSLDELQYIGKFEELSNSPGWLLGTVDNRNLGMTLRIDWAITPELTIQYYGSPFVSIGDYSELKEVTHPMDAYENRFRKIPFERSGKDYLLDSNGDGVYSRELMIVLPFSCHQFRNNLKYCVGNTFRVLLYTLSGHGTGQVTMQQGPFSFGEAQADGRVFPGNVFMIKLNYWFAG